ncbi:MAG: 3-deoxy-manno-octulosonate cytidylyltransferase [Gemmatimonadota bacterium]
MEIVCIIPTRMGSSRFRGKPLAPILGRPMVEHVYRRAILCKALSAVYVATCDDEIRRAVEAFGGRVVMTSPAHERASDRAAEASEGLRADVVVMLQGDEPMVTPEMIGAVVEPFVEDATIVCTNLVKRIEREEEFEDRNTIKVVMDERKFALYFSREPIPTRRIVGFGGLPAYKQVCVIPFRREFLLEFAQLRPTPLEQAESIDMLRVLEHGYRVKLVETSENTQAVDTPGDLALVESLMRWDPLVRTYAGTGVPGGRE